MDNEPTRFKIETIDYNEATLMINSHKLANAIYEVMNWRHALYNGKDYDIKVLYHEQIYKYNDWIQNFDTYKRPEDTDEHGYIKNGLVHYIYTDADIIRKIEDLLGDTINLVDSNYK